MMQLVWLIVVILIAAVVVYFIDQLPGNATLKQIAKGLIICGVAIWAILFVAGLITGHSYLPWSWR